MVASISQVGDAPKVAELVGSVKVMMDSYEEAKIDRLYVVYNQFINTMTQTPTVQQMLPLPKQQSLLGNMGSFWDYIYEVN